jgi:hypothetical protein
MPITSKGKKIMKSMKKEYGSKKGEQIFYASKNKGTIKGVEGKTMKKESIDSKKRYVDFINNICNNDYAAAKVNMQTLVDMKIKEKINKSSSKS